jgi:hypothetical protein
MFKIILAAVFAIAALPIHAALSQQLLDEGRIRDLLVGKSALFADYSVATYGTDGGYSYVAANNLFF